MSFFNSIITQTRRNLKETWSTQLFTFLSVSLSVLIFVFFFLVYINLVRAGGSLGGGLRLTLYLEEEPTPPLLEQLKEKIREHGEAGRTVYVPRKEAFARLSRHLGGDRDVLAGLDPSFLPPSLEVYPRPELKSLKKIMAFADYLATLPGVQKVQYGKEWVQRFSSFTQLLRIIVLVSGGLLMLTTIFMVSQTIRLTLVSRQDELEIFRLLGADKTYIQGPLLVEGFLQGLLGSAFGLFLLYLLYNWVQTRFATSEILSAFRLTFFSPAVLAAVILGSVGLCTAGSLVSTRKYLRI
ncbi:MAG: permease-like cell division protein FtsX [Deltaproteobacteria bacterium]